MSGLYLIANKVVSASRVMHDEDNLAYWGKFGPYPTFSMELHLRVQKALFFLALSMKKEKRARKPKVFGGAKNLKDFCALAEKKNLRKRKKSGN